MRDKRFFILMLLMVGVLVFGVGVVSVVGGSGGGGGFGGGTAIGGGIAIGGGGIKVVCTLFVMVFDASVGYWFGVMGIVVFYVFGNCL